MASGPPPSAAESSKMASSSTPNESPNTSTASGSHNPSAKGHQNQHQNPYASLANVQQSYQTYWQNAWPMYPSAATTATAGGGGGSTIPQGSTTHYSTPNAAYAPYQSHYYNMPMNPAAATSAPSLTSTPNAHLHSNLPSTSNKAPTATTSAPSAMKMETDDRPSSLLHSSSSHSLIPPSTVCSSPPPPPLPEYEHWDEALRVFLREAGLIQALRGFECDMIVMNDCWEKGRVPLALERLINGLSGTREVKGKDKEQDFTDSSVTVQPEAAADANDHSLEERKLGYVNLSTGEKARTPSSINKEISLLLARNRSRNDASNRAEFLLSLSEKRKRLHESGDSVSDEADVGIASCARTDARTIDRDVQMKYDIAKNDEGPLRRTKAKRDERDKSVKEGSSTRAEGPVVVPSDEEALPKHHPGADERLNNIEAHLAVRYVPSPPRTLWSRLKFLEEHIIRLEKDYPPWAALHFNQPNRGWPPPPRATPIIVPPHLRSSDPDEHKPSAQGAQGQQASTSAPSVTLTGGSKPRNTKSSLQRAVMEKLEVKQAMGESADFGG